MNDVLLVKYGEIALRGRNRSMFENGLLDDIRARLRPLKNYTAWKEQGRFVIGSRDGAFDFQAVKDAVYPVFGIIGVCEAVCGEEYTVKAVADLALSHVKKSGIGGDALTFKVETKRADKRFPQTSYEVSAAVGGYLLDNCPKFRVDVKAPQKTIFVEIRTKVYVYSERTPCLGGLPAGSSGRGLLLLSGGFDSPVAGFLAAKRGVALDCVYFHAPPYTSEKAREKVEDLARRLSVFAPGLRLFVVNFTDLQVAVKDGVPPKKMTIIVKRCMFRVAEIIARKLGANALFTGESIGQVASQTLASMDVIHSVVNMPVFCPVIAMDKQEIMDLAEKIGTHAISIRPFDDCCTLFLADSPETKPKLSSAERTEGDMVAAGVPLPEMMEKAAETAEIVEFAARVNNA
jgi:thiamine biosynthesis protein ThiI